MVSRIRIGPDGGPYVILDEDNGTLDIDAPSNDIDLQSNELLNVVLGAALDANANQIQNAVLQNASLADSLDASNQNITNGGRFENNRQNSGNTNTTNRRIQT